MMWAACCVAFFGFLHFSKFTIPSQNSNDQAYYLSLANLTLKNCCLPTLVCIPIKQFRTDPEHPLLSKKSHKGKCPICTVIDHFIARGARPLFLWPNGNMLTRNLFASELINILHQINANPQLYNTHT